MVKKDGTTSWTTRDELAAINYMACKDKNGYNLAKPSTEEGIRRRLTSWLETSKTRIWHDPIDLDKCREHARSLINGLT